MIVRREAGDPWPPFAYWATSVLNECPGCRVVGSITDKGDVLVSVRDGPRLTISTVQVAPRFDPAALASVAYVALLQLSLEAVRGAFVLRLGEEEITASAVPFPKAE